MIKDVLRVLLCIAEIVLCFLPIFKETAHLSVTETAFPDAVGAMKKVYHHSMMENLSDMSVLMTLFFIAVLLTALIISFITLFHKTEKIKKIGNVIFIISLIMFVILFFISAGYHRNY